MHPGTERHWSDVLHDFEALSPLDRRRLIGAHVFGRVRVPPRRALYVLASLIGAPEVVHWWHALMGH